MKPQISAEARAFQDGKAREVAQALQVAALQICCGLDFREVMEGRSDRAASMIERAIERERLKGLARHWSYDLNRHIALKQALDRLRENGAGTSAYAKTKRPGANRIAARRLRRAGKPGP